MLLGGHPLTWGLEPGTAVDLDERVQGVGVAIGLVDSHLV
eukprot:CAMPEP_0185779288 /NCGR_PEP_ID=MMETSP1174-20130828/95350_1 /TAXON_ID=35687 /ORGANISM="Dictyocha speculum, Strain CCMP1381" /LENGTH=39 /DNA_ID= /DNA_START= /DNA_END= /DNA_ORIENTATION=